MSAPLAYTVHDGRGTPPKWRRDMVADWLRDNGINPDHVTSEAPITVLTVPLRPAESADDGEPWLVQVIVLSQYHVNEQGAIEQNLITRRPVTFQRTVPLRTPFPADPATADEGARRGEADSQAAQEAPQEQVRPAGSTPVSHRHEGAGQERSRPGRAERIEGDPKNHPRQGHQAIPEPEEDRRWPGGEVTR